MIEKAKLKAAEIKDTRTENRLDKALEETERHNKAMEGKEKLTANDTYREWAVMLKLDPSKESTWRNF